MKSTNHRFVSKDGYFKIYTSRGCIGTVSFLGDRCGEQQRLARSFQRALEQHNYKISNLDETLNP